MKKLLLALAIAVSMTTSAGDGFIVIDETEIVLVEGTFINILHTELRGGKIW